MAHKKKHGPAPVPAANLPQSGPPDGANAGEQAQGKGGSPFHEQDAKRRLGDYESAGEHARKQPTSLNDGQQHSK